MGKRELSDFWDESKNKHFQFHKFFHLGSILLTAPMALLEYFYPDFEGLPYIIEVVLYFIGSWSLGAVFFGVFGLLFMYLGLITYKDYRAYYTFVCLWIIGGVFGLVYELDFELVVVYGFCASWAMILIVSLMNRFNNMSKKIDDIHKKLNS